MNKKVLCLPLDAALSLSLAELSARESRHIADFLREGLGRGRPQISKKKERGEIIKKMDIKLTEKQFKKLESLAREAGISKSEAARQILQKQVDKYSKKGE
ncbi:MAG: ribbon-helix-helix protein, CopG family [Desulfuromonadales bacterium]|nr:ribbon-helix-helix protein, CopG family [Desulfuromonadales bacterium]MDW7757282.1 ribbon-helix-helix protein, CopG family [Desulfuromonadales bacterium]